MTSVRKAIVLSLAQRYAAFLIQFFTAIVLARLLTPAETGIFSLAAAVAGIAQMMRDFGVGEYVVQERELSRDRLRSALGLTFIMSWAIAAVLLALSYPVAKFYKEPGIAQVIHILALNFIIIPFGSTTFAVLTKELAYGTMFRVQTYSAIVGAIVCIFLAYHGYSYMSMAWSSLAGIAVTVLMLAILRPAETLMAPRFTGLRTVVKFGGTLTVGRLADQLCRRMPDFAIGSNLGFSAVGINSKATSLLDAFNDFFASGISRVAVPAFAKGQRSPEKSREDYLRANRILLVFPFVFYAFCVLFAEPIILIMFGSQWLGAVPLICISGVACLFISPYLLASPALTAYGRVHELLRMQLIGAVVLLPAVYFASKYNLVAVAIASACATVPRFIILQTAMTRTFGLTAREIYGGALPSLAVALIGVTCAAPALLIYERNTLSGLHVLLTAAAGLTIGSIGSAILIKHPLVPEVTEMWRKTYRASRQRA